MAITKSQFVDKVKRRLGHPMVKVELCNDQIVDHIDYARTKFIKWAIGNATQEVFFTVLLQAGKTLYDLPAGVTEVIGCDDSPIATGGINTLFTVENFLFSNGYYGNIFSGGYDLVSYHVALDFLSTLNRYRTTPYTFRYHKSTNQLEVTPTPMHGNTPRAVTMPHPSTGVPTNFLVDSPGYLLVRSYMLDGATLPNKVYEWQDIVREVKTVVEQRTVTATDIENKSMQLEHKPYENDGADYNVQFDMSVSAGGIDQQYNYDWRLHPNNNRLLSWEGLTLDGQLEEGDELVLTYPTVIFSPYYPDEWDTVTGTLTETEEYVIEQRHIDNGYITLQKNVWNDGNGFQIAVSTGSIDQSLGVDYTVDAFDSRQVKWRGLGLDGMLEVGDRVNVEYVTVVSYRPTNSSTATGTSYDKTYMTKIENRLITAEEITAGQLVINEPLVAPDGMKLSTGGSERVYNVDFKVLNDNVTIDWNGMPLQGNIGVGDAVVVTYTSAEPILTEWEEDLYDNDWMLDYVTAMSKISLGYIRRKFANYASMGNQGIQMDGDSLISEGTTEKEYLETTLRDEEAYEGYGIDIGFM